MISSSSRSLPTEKTGVQGFILGFIKARYISSRSLNLKFQHLLEGTKKAIQIIRDSVGRVDIVWNPARLRSPRIPVMGKEGCGWGSSQAVDDGGSGDLRLELAVDDVTSRRFFDVSFPLEWLWH